VWLGPDGTAWDRPHLDAGLHGLGPTYRIYRTQDESWICVAAVTPEERAALETVVGPDLEAGFAQKTALQWTRLLDDAGVPNEIVVESRDGAAFLHDDDNVRLGLVTSYDHPVLGRLRQFGSLIDFSETPGVIAGPPPLVGQHSRAVLQGAGYLDGDIDALVSSGVVYEAGEDYEARFSI